MKALLGLTLMAMLVANQPRKVLLFYNENGIDKWRTQVEALKKYPKDIQERDIEVKSFSSSKENISECTNGKSIQQNHSLSFDRS